MTAQRLREAAKVARETAQAATPGPWDLYDDGIYVGRTDVEIGIEYDAQVLEIGDPDLDEFVTEPDAAHIALWSPPVALAVAAWLDSVADAATPPDGRPGVGRDIAPADEEAALAVAASLLGPDTG